MFAENLTNTGQMSTRNLIPTKNDSMAFDFPDEEDNNDAYFHVIH
jgi:hypothetical protein